MSDDRSKLEDEIKARIAAGKVIVVAGAGVTVASVDPSAKSNATWIGLLHSGLDAVTAYNKPAAGNVKRWRGMLKAGDIDELVLVAEKITMALGGEGGGDFQNWLDSSVGSLSIADRSVIDAIARFDAPIITTNYDDLLATGTQRKSLLAKRSRDVEDWLKSRRESILHLHGHCREGKSVVLGLRAYDAILENDVTQVLMKSMPLEFSLVFIGCGAGLDDANFGALLDWMRINLPDTRHHHYRLCLKSEEDGLWKHHPIQQRIKPVSYGKKHHDLAAFLRNLVPAGAPSEPPSDRVDKSRSTAPTHDAEIEDYRKFVLSRAKRVSMKALQAGEVDFEFDDVYVPLRTSSFQHDLDLDATKTGYRRADLASGCQSVDVETLFREQGGMKPNLLILGDPGSGKTTALKKLAHLLLTGEHAKLGLAEGSLPVMLRLRSLRASHLNEQLVDFIERELQETSEPKLPAGLGNKLLARGQLVLLFDGLDEIGDESLRAKVCRHLDRVLEPLAERGIRAVVSCRRLGYRGDVKFSERFACGEVQPLDADNVDRFVTRWFDTTAKHEPPTKRSETLRQRDDLIKALRRPPFSDQSYKLLVGNPLLLTILCIVVHRGHLMPKRRAQFFDLCLTILLTWSTQDGGDPAPLDPPDAEALLRRIAWQQHAAHRRDDMTEGFLLDKIREHTANSARQGVAKPPKVLSWLSTRAAVLDQFAPRQFGFFHLGLQEYLAAKECSLGMDKPVIQRLAKWMLEPWWREVGLMFCGVAGTAQRDVLLQALLQRRGAVRYAHIIRECLEEAESPSLSTLVRALAKSKHVDEQLALLRLLMHRRDPAMLELVRKLATTAEASVRSEARRVLDASATAGDKTRDQLLLVFRSEDAAAASDLAIELRKRGWTVFGESEQPPTFQQWPEDTSLIEETCRLLLFVVVDAKNPPWQDRDLGDIAHYLAESMPVRVVRAPCAALPKSLPKGIDATGVLDCSRGFKGAVLRALDHLDQPKVPATLRDTTSDIDVELTTGIRFLPVPAGSFRMGRKDGSPRERPVHSVSVAAFSLSETPITNHQYSAYLTSEGVTEPAYWRNSRFSDPHQPVVGISHHEARSFCAWLSRISGRRVRLPSEIEWEYAARGMKSWKYPWGDEPEPNTELAGFDLNYGNPEHRPANVGSFPNGKGPFGHLDLAGLVWEWCEDVWSEDVYSRRSKGERIEANGSGDPDFRVLRGGSWGNSAAFLTAAVRLRYLASLRYGFIGFRIVSVPANSGLSAS